MITQYSKLNSKNVKGSFHRVPQKMHTPSTLASTSSFDKRQAAKKIRSLRQSMNSKIQSINKDSLAILKQEESDCKFTPIFSSRNFNSRNINMTYNLNQVGTSVNTSFSSDQNNYLDQNLPNIFQKRHYSLDIGDRKETKSMKPHILIDRNSVNKSENSQSPAKSDKGFTPRINKY